MDVFVDANVFLACGQSSDLERQARTDLFLERFRSGVVIGPDVKREVFWQMQTRPHKYPEPMKIYKRMLEAQMLDVESRSLRDEITRLEQIYATCGWHEKENDTYDRIHAATASIFKIPRLVTWDAPFLTWQGCVTQMNQAHGYPNLRICTPVD